MSELEVVAAVVLSHLTAGVGKVVAAPLEAVAAEVRERFAGRLRRVGQNAKWKADGEPIEATERVLYKALLEAGISDDEIMVDYLGGVLAASGPDDAGAPIIAQIGRLSAMQLRLHHIIYRESRRLCREVEGITFYDDSARRAEISMDSLELVAAADCEWNAVGSGLSVLAREGLIRTFTMMAPKDDGPGRTTIMPTGLGAEFFAWGNGGPLIEAMIILAPDDVFQVRFETSVQATPSTSLITPLPD